ncbi:hypothetical protein [Paenibacillus agricola]|uniref:Uncharacterized protein n=1 Tax=Paenibacillus agricola TaxID=2716264 RepID=A0ABX0JG63_9BACL|nr:hypothetical protein [Paenibacillus agricola]NHN33882.1 hypothetical protein [Paenibacillus agricola]
MMRWKPFKKFGWKEASSLNMRHILFLAHDPGGCDVTRPVFNRLKEQDKPANYFCVGPAAVLLQEYAITEIDLFQYLSQQLELGNIAVLVTGTSWGTDAELRAIRLCQSYNVSTISILDYWSNYSMRLMDQSNDRITPDFYIVMDELAKQEAIKDGVSDSIIRVLGHPGLDVYIHNDHEQKNEIYGVVNANILFLSQPLSLLYNDALGYTEYSVLESLINAANEADMKIHVKFHPKDDLSFKEKYQLLAVEGDLLHLVPKYELIIGMSSMALLHAVLMGKTTVSYQPNLRKADMSITNKLGLSAQIHEYVELVHYLSNFSLISRKKRPNGTHIWLDGKSTERVALFIEDVFHNGKN